MRRPAKKIVLWPWLFITLSSSLILRTVVAAEFPSSSNAAGVRTFAAGGVIEEISADAKTVVIHHGAISNFMEAMTMPFAVRDPKTLANFQRGDQVNFQLHVTATDSWVDDLVKTGTITLPEIKKNTDAKKNTTPEPSKNPLLDYKFTNELGQAVSLNDFRGKALGITFFYTRCPLPNYCPRLSKNFQEASQKLESMTNPPVNWHFLSVSFDTEFDKPPVLEAYAKSYQYDPKHWSFLTGPADKIGELARESGVAYESDNGTINHNFRTLIVDATGHLQMVFVTSGDLSDQIVAEILKAAAVTNRTGPQNQND